MARSNDLPPAVADVLGHWVDVHDRVAPHLIEGVYVVGSAALGDWRPGSDVDIVAFTADPATDEDAEVLATAWRTVRERVEGASIDGPYLAWGDVSVPPQPLHRPWALGDEFHHDAECFEINPVTWYVLATAGIAVRGEPAAALGVAVDTDERRAFVRQNADTYWRAVAEQVGSVLDGDPARSEFMAATQEWVVLGACRMAYTHATGDVASKSAAGDWAIAELPAHAAVVRDSLAIRRSASGPVDRADVEAALDLLGDVVMAITGRRVEPR